MSGTYSHNRPTGLGAAKNSQHFEELRADLVRLCGPEAAEAFFRAFAGSQVYIPLNPLPDGPLAKALGLQAAELFAAEYGGERIDVPAAHLSAANARVAEIEAALLSGRSVRDVARLCACTDRAVYNARRRLRQKGRLP